MTVATNISMCTELRRYFVLPLFPHKRSRAFECDSLSMKFMPD